MSEIYTIDDVKWADDEISPDYLHLETPADFRSFEFSRANLEKLCKSNSFNLKRENDFSDEIIFGLRGCRIAGNDLDCGSFVSEIRLVEAVPDHKQSCCVLGVWKRSTNDVAVFPGSTVPFWEAMIKQIENKDRKICNLLSTGLYKYAIGTHKKSDEEYKICGVLRQEGSVPVLRTKDDLIFDVTDEWDFANVGDNIHPSRFANPEDTFSSEGCLTIPGGGFFMGDAEHDGLWSKFREALALNPTKPLETENGKKYILILLTGREARLAVDSEGQNLNRLRFGSSGASVKKLQTALKNHKNNYYKHKIDGELSVCTVRAYINWQKDFDEGKADGIVTPETAENLGFKF